MDIEQQQDSDLQEVEDLLDLAFGEDRFNKAAYAYRKGVDAIRELSFIIRDQGQLIATLRFWPIKIGNNDALLLGPIAVKPELQGCGHGIRLMKHGLKRASELGYSRVILVGDEPYYGRLGFSREHIKDITMPGQDDHNRLLGHELLSGSFYGVFGAVRQI